METLLTVCFKEFFQYVFQLYEILRLFEIHICTQYECFFYITFLIRCGINDNGDISEAHILTHIVQALFTIFERHIDIQKNDVWKVAFSSEFIQQVFAIYSCRDGDRFIYTFDCVNKKKMLVGTIIGQHYINWFGRHEAQKGFYLESQKGAQR